MSLDPAGEVIVKKGYLLERYTLGSFQGLPLWLVTKLTSLPERNPILRYRRQSDIAYRELLDFFCREQFEGAYGPLDDVLRTIVL